MAIVIDNSSDKISLGDVSLQRKSAGALVTGGSLDVAGLNLTGTGNGVTFPDNSVQTSAATPYTLPNASASVLGGVKVGTGLSIDGSGVLSATGGSGSGITDVYNNTARYQMVTTANTTVSCVSTATVRGAISWTRTGTTLTLTKTAHGHSAGNRVIIRNTNVDYQVALITSVTANTFDITCTDTGATSGSSGAYMLGFTYAHNAGAGSITSGTLTAPSGGDVQLVSLRIHLGANTRSATTYNLVLPSSSINGAGSDTSMDDIYIPVQNVRQDNATLTAVGATIATNISGSYSTFQYAALPVVATGIHILMSF